MAACGAAAAGASQHPILPRNPTSALQVDGLEQALAAQDRAPLLAELEGCQARLRQAQAACGSKEAALRELRERLEQQTRCGGGWLVWPCAVRIHGCIRPAPWLCDASRLAPCPLLPGRLPPPSTPRLAHQQGALEGREQQQAAIMRLGQQLADRDAQVAELHQKLRQVHAELAAASAGLQATAASQSAAAEGAAAQLEEAGSCTRQLAQAVQLLLEMLAQLGGTAAAAAEQEAARSGSQVGLNGKLGAAYQAEAVLVDQSHPIPCYAPRPCVPCRRTPMQLQQRPAAWRAWWAWMPKTLHRCCCLRPVPASQPLWRAT